MRVFLAGATGAIGKRLVPATGSGRSFGDGHDAFDGEGHRPSRAGADAVVVDALDPAAVATAVEQPRPEVIIHELTAIPQDLDIAQIRGAVSTNEPSAH